MTKILYIPEGKYITVPFSNSELWEDYNLGFLFGNDPKEYIKEAARSWKVPESVFEIIYD